MRDRSSAVGTFRSMVFRASLLGALGAVVFACGNKVEWVGQDGIVQDGPEADLGSEPEDPADLFPSATGGTGMGGQGSEGDPPDVEPGPGSGPPSPTVPILPELFVPDELIWPDACGARWQYACESYDPLMNCYCDLGLSEELPPCGGFGRLYCEHFFAGGFDVWVDCECRAEAPNSASDCLDPASFACLRTSETGEGEQCSCRR